MDQPDTPARPVIRALMSHAFTVLVFLAFLAMATGLRFGLIQQDNQQIQTNLENEALALANSLEREFMLHVEAVGRIAKRMLLNPAMTESAWRGDVKNYLADFGSYHSINWIDTDYVIRWLESMNGNPKALGRNMADAEQSHAALQRAAESGQFYISGILDLIQGGEGIVIYQPVGEGENNNGFVAGVFQIDVLARQLLTQRVLEQFQVTIIPQGQRVYRLNTSADIDPDLEYTVPVVLPRLFWSLTLAPTTAWVERQRSDWPNRTFSTLLIMGILTSLTILLAQLMLKRKQALLKTRQELDQEIAQRIAIQSDLERLESNDPLTGLANRRFFMEDLSHSINLAERQSRQLALVMIDLDRFQMLNDSLGHQFGDELLVRVSERLNQLSNERILVAYSGGDEFMVCQQHVDDIDDVIHLLGQIKGCFLNPFDVQGNRHTITATMGVAVYPQSGLDADNLLRNADIALYRAKEQGRASYQFYTEGMQNREVLRLELDQDLSRALANNEFVLHYQPQLNLDTGEITSVEALIRWQHPRRGLLPPIDFIPLAEESGRITEIGHWVMQAACQQLARWHAGEAQPASTFESLSTCPGANSTTTP
ncbi:diguanylate cyclase domain-containing protein [Marinobacter fuscus]|uniref:bifunctional diguanylate cyclase/phosphodiesterase n=1 Tax=Marinobacter fuscus TaxID=2109942 RepID=UPI001F0B8D61|nr:diguanylate cyclase [Marinobacter fuscus]